VIITLRDKPKFLYDCNCSLCRKSGALWGYFAISEVSIEGKSSCYYRNDRDSHQGALHFCTQCGSTTSWLPDNPSEGATAIINMRLFDQTELADIPVEFPDGANWSGQGPFGFRAPVQIHRGISH
jgi:hypothetical protein